MSDHTGVSERPARVPKPRPGPLFPPERSASSSAKVRVNDHQTAVAQVGSYGTFDPSGKSRRVNDEASSPKRMSFVEYFASPHSPLVQIRSHCQQQWVAILLTIVLLGFTLYFLLGTSVPPIGAHCVTPFGTYLGESNGVVAYSNCNRRFFGSNMDHYVRIGVQRVATGTKWRSLEYVRRYWMLTRQLVLPNVLSSDRLLDLEDIHVTSKTLRDVTVALQRFRNLPKPLAELTPALSSETPSLSARMRSSRDAADRSVASLEATAADSARRGSNANKDGGRVNANGVPLATWVLNRQTALPREGDIIAYATQKPNWPYGHAAIVVHVSGPFRNIGEMGSRMKAYLERSGEEGALLNSSAEDEHARAVPLDTLREEQHDLAKSSTTSTSSKLGTQAGSLFYQVFIAEQNADNWYWADPLTEKDAADLEKRSSTNTKEASMFTSAFKVGVPHPPPSTGNRTHNDQDTLFLRRPFSRVLLLREYYPSHTYHLEDTLHSRILGWIRPTEQHT